MAKSPPELRNGGLRLLIASIPFDVKELVLIDNLPHRGIASADHHLKKKCKDPLT
jgi:hypothetical protein